jgi:hypothetical protein
VTTTEFMNRRQWRSITFLVIRRLEEPLGRGSSAAQAFRQLLNSTDWYSNGFAQMDDVQLSPRDHLVQGRAANAERSRRLNDCKKRRLLLARRDVFAPTTGRTTGQLARCEVKQRVAGILYLLVTAVRRIIGPERTIWKTRGSRYIGRIVRA